MLAGCHTGAAGIIVLLYAKIYKKMYIRNLPFSVIVPICYQMCLNVDFSGLFDNKKNRAVLEEIATFQVGCPVLCS